MQTDPLKLRNAGDVSILELKLISDSGVELDIRPLMIELNIFESYDTSYLSGNIVIVDTLNIVNNLPITGNESLIMEFKTPGTDASIRLLMRVYSVTNRIVEKEAMQGYQINFISPEKMENEQIQISKAFSDSCSNIANQIFNENILQLGRTDPVNLINQLEPTFGKLDIVIPFMTPFEAINHLTSISYKKSKSVFVGNFVFFQTVDGFNFVSLDTLFSQSPIALYNRTLANIRNRETGLLDMNNEFFKIMSYSIGNDNNNNTDQLKNITSGTLSSRLTLIDLNSKAFKEIDFDYNKQFFGTNHLGSGKLTSNKSKLNEQFNSKRLMLIENTNLFNQNRRNFNFDRFKQSRLSSLNSLMTMDLIVPGNSTLRVGQVISVEIPSLTSQESSEKMDPMFSGNWLITSLRHNVKKNFYATSIQLSRDCYQNLIPDQTSIKD